MTNELDPKAFRQSLERACEKALFDYRGFQSEETYHRAYGKIQGITEGVYAVAKILGDEGGEVVEIALEVTERYSAMLKRMEEWGGL